MPGRTEQTQLIVFSDDWGRHPSSCQHLVRQLMATRGPALAVTWVNTIGTRAVRWSWADVRRAAGKLAAAGKTASGERGGETIPAFASLRRGLAGERAGIEVAPRVVSPLMWPGFRSRWQRRVNAAAMRRAVRRAAGPKREGVSRVVLSTLPITADLVGPLDADRWVYMAVDDFSVWPGLDGSVMDAMEREQAARVDACVAAGETLRARLAGMGRAARVITHGIDLDHWRQPQHAPPAWTRGVAGQSVVFWGLIDARLDAGWCRRVVESTDGTLVLVGPIEGELAGSLRHERIVTPGKADYAELPAIAAWADVLVMPYVDAAVTRAMQPLKLKEYLATGTPAVVRDLPATRPWADACDVVGDAEAMVTAVQARLRTGLPPEQVEARRRLTREAWAEKAGALWAELTEDAGASAGLDSNPPPRGLYTHSAAA